jgi:hypothetical protein
MTKIVEASRPSYSFTEFCITEHTVGALDFASPGPQFAFAT